MVTEMPDRAFQRVALSQTQRGAGHHATGPPETAVAGMRQEKPWTEKSAS